jgi:hypothetical protein
MALLGIIFSHLPTFLDVKVVDHDEIFGSQSLSHGCPGQAQKALDEDEGGKET